MNWLNNGQSIKVPVGNYKIFFKELEGFQTPEPVIATINKNETTVIQVEYISPSTNGAWGSRGVVGGNYRNNTGSSNIEYINITTTGNGIYFGELSRVRQGVSACSSSTKGLFAGGYPDTATIDYINIAVISNSSNYGNLNSVKYYAAGCSNKEVGLFGGGWNSVRVIESISLSTLGNATFFGNFTPTQRTSVSACSNTERALFLGGDMVNIISTSSIDYVTIQTSSDANHFGYLTMNRSWCAACCNSTKAICIGASGGSTIIDYVTIATTGNATIFGYLNHSLEIVSACSDGIKGVVGYGYVPLEYITFETLSNASTFGNLFYKRNYHAACSGN